MAIAAIPSNLTVQVANAQAYLLFNAVPGATSYQVQRSIDGVNFSNLATTSVPSYLDTSVSAGTQYWWHVASVNSSGTSSYSSAVTAIPAITGQASLQQIRLWAQQRADRVNSNFVSLPEWNDYIRSSLEELYDLLVTVYEDYFQKVYSFTTDGVNQAYSLPADFYKLLGVDLSLNGTANAKVTLKKFDLIERNRFVYPEMGQNALGFYNPAYRIVGSTIEFIPTPSGTQSITLLYVPRISLPLAETDIVDGVNGWIEYVVVDAAIKALQKEEQDVSVLFAQKAALAKRIEESAMNRDAGQPDTISRTRNIGRSGPNGDGSFGGY